MREWFAQRGWTPFPYQEEAWRAFADGESGLVHAATGTGKTYAVWGGALRTDPKPVGLRVLWITPLRALAQDTVQALQAPVEELGLPWTVAGRTGDTPSHVKQRQRRKLPHALVTTPESLSLLLSYADARKQFAGLQAVVVDEWHELLGTKRGVQVELALARLRRWRPELRTWGISATLGNLEEARDVLLAGAPGRLVRGGIDKRIAIETLIPPDMDRFPWAGHLGLKLLPSVLTALEGARTSLLFTNTRNQAERWFRAILDARPDWLGQVAIHHGSVAREVRGKVEAALGGGALRCVVCTSSLDLGIDFAPVEQVLQVGSPKGVARLLQRAGRSGHQPGALSRVLCVPSHAFELVEYAAARRALEAGEIESRPPLERPLDVLVQHLVTVALGGGFEAEALRDEVRGTHAFRALTDADWAWALAFARTGGTALEAYPRYRRLEEREGRFVVPDRTVQRHHRMMIGTITSDRQLEVKVRRGQSLGSVEESFVARLRPGDTFVFGGRTLELLSLREGRAVVRKAKGAGRAVPVWFGGRMPLSSQLADAVRRELADPSTGPETDAVRPLLDLQRTWSVLAGPEELLVERTRTRDGHHLFLYPFAGRLAHEGLATLLAYRLTRDRASTVTYAVTDYGLELLSDEALDPDWRALLAVDGVRDDLVGALNATELARRRFRQIARVAGLVFEGYPGQAKSARQVQASTNLLFDVLAEYDDQNLLLAQARREVMEAELDLPRVSAVLARAGEAKLVLRETDRLTPFAFPIWAERVRAHVTSESWEARVRKMVAQLENHAGQLVG
ncbi:MAG: ligase-associated DNA damage response DEXH box helicase [Planctomycetota bacterium]